jgi:hypothetical protein
MLLIPDRLYESRRLRRGEEVPAVHNDVNLETDLSIDTAQISICTQIH